ncbi:hypothetical protein DC20_15810 [Rufibacter tibetensis]|uniref:TM2 domain-containing protein n=1 Tax=Rufibacter tibetensis TaxID=512763 RepID=A0A0P0CXH4_9BACT|nr:hypothetical protein DC20_15810 [Rufibacter tibetensis]
MVLKSKTTATILSFLLGGLGAHHFYLENKKRGLLYLAFFWTLIPAVVGFVEFILLVTQSEDDFNLKYNPGEFCEKYRKPHSMPVSRRGKTATTSELNLEEQLLQVH